MGEKITLSHRAVLAKSLALCRPVHEPVVLLGVATAL